MKMVRTEYLAVSLMGEFFGKSVSVLELPRGVIEYSLVTWYGVQFQGKIFYEETLTSTFELKEALIRAVHFAQAQR